MSHRQEREPRPPCCRTLVRGPFLATAQETAERWGQTEAYVRRLAQHGRIEGAFKTVSLNPFSNLVERQLRFLWRIPPDAPKPTLFYTRPTTAEKEEIVRRRLNGEQRKALAKEYGVTADMVYSYVQQAKRRESEATGGGEEG